MANMQWPCVGREYVLAKGLVVGEGMLRTFHMWRLVCFDVYPQSDSATVFVYDAPCISLSTPARHHCLVPRNVP